MMRSADNLDLRDNHGNIMADFSELLDAPASRFQRDGEPAIAYRVVGERGPCVLLIQGVAVAGRAWAPQLEGLRGEFRLCAIDNRGIGESEGSPENIEQMASDALALLDHLGWSTAHVAGHSMGGLVAQALALEAPERVESLSLLCTFADGKQAVMPRLDVMWIQLKSQLGTTASRRQAFFELVSPPSLHRDASRIDELEHVFGRHLAKMPDVVPAQMRAMMRFNRSDQLHRLGQIPCVVVSATHDRVAPVKFGKSLAACLDAEFVEIPGGHAVCVQDAEAVNTLLARMWTTPTS